MVRNIAVPAALVTGIAAHTQEAHAAVPSEYAGVTDVRARETIDQLFEQKEAALKTRQAQVREAFKGVNVQLDMKIYGDGGIDSFERYTVTVGGVSLGEIVGATSLSFRGRVEFIGFSSDEAFISAVKKKLDAAEVKYTYNPSATASAPQSAALEAPIAQPGASRAETLQHPDIAILGNTDGANALMQRWGGKGVTGWAPTRLVDGRMVVGYGFDVSRAPGDEFTVSVGQSLEFAPGSNTLTVTVDNGDNTRSVIVIVDGKVVIEQDVDMTQAR